MKLRYSAPTIIIISILLGTTLKSAAQRIGSINCYGGISIGGSCADGDDEMGIIKTSDGGYAFVTSSNVSGGDLTGNYGSCDVWIVKTDAQGTIQWQTNIGGSDSDLGYSICETSDTCYYVACYTFSSDGMMSCNSANFKDYILKFDRNGNILHQRCFGGSCSEERPHLTRTNDDGCIVTSTTCSNDGDVSGLHGGAAIYDIWIVRFDSSLNIIWQHCYGGANVETSGAIANDPDGGFIFAGRARSVDGDLSFNYGNYDLWMVKIDGAGNIQWKQSIGGSQWDIPYSIVLAPDSSIYLAGYTSSTDYDVSGNHGFSDVWVLKFDHSGNLLWNKCYGGSHTDQAYNIVQSLDGNFIISGVTQSNNGDVSGNTANSSGWVIKIDSSGTLLWQKCIPFFPNEIINEGNGNEIFISRVTAFNPYTCNRGLIMMGKLLPSNFISGNVYVDYNSSSLQDAGEPVYPNVFVRSVKAGIDTSYSYTNQNGAFWNYPDSGNYITDLPNGVRYYNYLPAQFASSFASSNQYDTINFALTPIPGIHDLELTVIPVTGSRLGWTDHLQLHYSNAGTDTSSGTVYLIKDSRLSFSSSTPVPDGISGDSIYWNYTSLLPLESRNIEVLLDVPVPPVLLPGDTLISYAEILPASGDSTPANNFSMLEQIATGSFDPNDKIVLTEDTISVIDAANGAYIKYLIRFQNTGNATALNVFIEDNLSNYLDPSSLEMISASHPYQIIREQNQVTWSFGNIQLPDSNTDEVHSHGFVCFKIKTKASIVSTSISNQAAIYFDNNPAVQTNWAYVVVVNITSTSELLSPGSMNLFPNPTSGKTFVSLNDKTDMIEAITLTNTFGEKVFAIHNSGDADLRPLPNGIYFLEVITKKQQRCFQTIIKKE